MSQCKRYAVLSDRYRWPGQKVLEGWHCLRGFYNSIMEAAELAAKCRAPKCTEAYNQAGYLMIEGHVWAHVVDMETGEIVFNAIGIRCCYVKNGKMIWTCDGVCATF